MIVHFRHFVEMLTSKYNISQKNWGCSWQNQTLQFWTLEISLASLVVKPLEPTSVGLGSNPPKILIEVQFDFVGGPAVYAHLDTYRGR